MGLHVAATVAEIDAELRARGTRERAEQQKAYLKSDREHYGTSVPAVRAIVKLTARCHPDLTRDSLLGLVDALWSEAAHEHRMATVELLDLRRALLEPDDMLVLERLLREARTWALVDTLAANVVGDLVERHPELGGVLDRWAVDEDFWVRRAALLALLRPLRRGDGDFDRFSRYADALLDEHEFFIRKAVGWVLRETAKNRPDLVYE